MTIKLPPIPIPAPDIQNLYNTVVAMRQHLLAIGGSTPSALQPYINPISRDPRNNPSLIRPGAQDRSVPKVQPTEQARWVEHARHNEYVRLINPDDKTQTLVVQRTNRLEHIDTITGERWVYNIGPAGDLGGTSAQGTDGGTPILKSS